MRDVTLPALNLIKKSENDCDPKSGYQKINGIVSYIAKPDSGGIPTIGYGTIMYENGARVKLSDPAISEDRAIELLMWEIRSKSSQLDNWAKNHNITLNDNQFSALASFSYNLGAGIVTDNGHDMNAALLANDPAKIKAAFMLYVNVYKKIFGVRVGHVDAGLVTRRKAECALYFS